MKRMVALVPYVPGTNPGQRIRIETWQQLLRDYGWTCDLYPFEDARLHEVIYQPGYLAAKASRLLFCYARQFQRLRRMPPCDLIFIFQEAALVGPAWLERLAARRGVPVIYDYDDPRFLRYRSPTSGWASILKFSGKTRSLIRLADHVIAINGRLGAYAARYNSAVSIIPNCVDLERYRPSGQPSGDPPRLVWIGSHTTVPNLYTIAPVLHKLQVDCGTPIRLVGALPIAIEGVSAETLQWSAKTEVPDLQGCQIGLLPIADVAWNRWKFFYKAVQYMAVGLPVVAQRIGPVEEIIQDGVNGFIVDTQDEWYRRLRELIDNPMLRRRMGAAARATAVARYSLSAQIPRLASLLNQVAESHAMSNRPAQQAARHWTQTSRER